MYLLIYDLIPEETRFYLVSENVFNKYVSLNGVIGGCSEPSDLLEDLAKNLETDEAKKCIILTGALPITKVDGVIYTGWLL